MRNFGIMSKLGALGGASDSQPATRGEQYAPRDTDSFTFRDFSFPRGDGLQTLFDVATLIFCALFVCLTGVSITAAIFILLFVRL